MPASDVASATVTTPAATAARIRWTTSTPIAAARPSHRTAPLSHGSQSGVCSSSWYDHHAVTAMAPASTARYTSPDRRDQHNQAPMPTRAPMAGPRADV